MTSFEEKRPTHLSLMKKTAINDAQIYGKAFHLMADQITLIKEHAHALYMEALNRDIDPEEFDADYSLIELSLAEISNVNDLQGMPRVSYYNPERERVRRTLLGIDDEECDHS